MEEYIFINADGERFCELVDAPRDRFRFYTLHNAVLGIPLERWEAMPQSVRDSYETPDPVCRTCGEREPRQGDGWDGECAPCADLASEETEDRYRSHSFNIPGVT